ncbi:MAG: hypothetical protein HUJ26_21540 [Planctomycetaceae bacterium]|nr:hypothetical protein [Planctomycetaceae bacterium]
MNSRPLQIAFTTLTLALVVSMSLWVIHASHEQLGFSNGAGVTLQVPSVSPDQSDEKRPPDPFAEPSIAVGSESVGGQLSSRSLETATVSRQTVNPRLNPVEPSQKSDDPQETQEQPFELPAIDLTPSGTGAPTISQPTPPAEQLDVPADASPKAPAWLSVQATLKEEIEQLRQQQQQLNQALVRENEEAKIWKSQSNELSKHLESSQGEIDRLRQALSNLKQETSDLKTSLSEKSEKIEAIEAGLNAENDRLSDKPAAPSSDEESSPFVLPHLEPGFPSQEDTSLTEEDASLVPEVPEQTADIQPPKETGADIDNPNFIKQESSVLDEPTFEAAPQQVAELPTDEIVPRLTGKTPPPPLPRETTSIEVPQPTAAEPAAISEEPYSTGITESPFYGPVMTEQTVAEPKKRGLIYEMQDWFETFHDDDSCTDSEPLCTGDASTCDCPRCTASHQWIHPEEMMSYQATPHEPQKRGLLHQMKNWWGQHKLKRDIRYEPAIVGRPANATILPAAHAE